MSLRAFPRILLTVFLVTLPDAYGQDCLEHTIQAGPATGSLTPYPTIEKAVKAAKPGWNIVV